MIGPQTGAPANETFVQPGCERPVPRESWWKSAMWVDFQAMFMPYLFETATSQVIFPCVQHDSHVVGVFILPKNSLYNYIVWKTLDINKWFTSTWFTRDSASGVVPLDNGICWQLCNGLRTRYFTMPTWQSKWIKIPGRTWRFAQPPNSKDAFPPVRWASLQIPTDSCALVSQDDAVRWYSTVAAPNHWQKVRKSFEEAPQEISRHCLLERDACFSGFCSVWYAFLMPFWYLLWPWQVVQFPIPCHLPVPRHHWAGVAEPLKRNYGRDARAGAWAVMASEILFDERWLTKMLMENWRNENGIDMFLSLERNLLWNECKTQWLNKATAGMHWLGLFQ